MESQTLAERIRDLLDEKKGREIRMMDVRERTPVTDWFVFVSGSSAPHLKAMFEDVHVTLKQEGVQCYRRTGDPEGGWMVLDFVDVVVHIFTEEVRAYYALEELWEQGPSMDDTAEDGALVGEG